MLKTLSVQRASLPSWKSFFWAAHSIDIFQLFSWWDHQFIPPRAPHFGGLWEAAVKSAKFHFYRVVGGSILAIDELRTLLYEISIDSKIVWTLPLPTGGVCSEQIASASYTSKAVAYLFSNNFVSLHIPIWRSWSQAFSQSVCRSE